MPLIGPSEDEPPGAPHLERAPQLSLDDLRLGKFAVAPTIEPELGKQKRPIAGKVLQPREVGLERGLGLEEDVEADQTNNRDAKVLGARVIHEREMRNAGMLNNCTKEP